MATRGNFGSNSSLELQPPPSLTKEHHDVQSHSKLIANQGRTWSSKQEKGGPSGSSSDDPERGHERQTPGFESQFLKFLVAQDSLFSIGDSLTSSLQISRLTLSNFWLHKTHSQTDSGFCDLVYQILVVQDSLSGIGDLFLGSLSLRRLSLYNF